MGYFNENGNLTLDNYFYLIDRAFNVPATILQNDWISF